MLPASQTPRSQSQRSAALGAWQIGLVVFIAIYTIALGIGLLTNAVRPDRAYLLFVIPCLLPMLWCAIGFRQGGHSDVERDSGLLLSAIGWLLLAAAFLFKHFAIISAGADAYAAQAPSPASLLCAGIGVLLIVAGAVFSWQFWVQNYDS